MENAWRLYDALIGAIPPDARVTAAGRGPRWWAVRSSHGGLGMAYGMAGDSRPPVASEPVGAPLREVAALAKSWNFDEAGLGVAALNAWYAQPDAAARAGFIASEVNNFEQVFHPFQDQIAGKVVSVIGHFPFAPHALAGAAVLNVLERAPHPGDFPDPACEYLLPASDVVFISGSAMVNKTLPRLLELSRTAQTIVLGPSTPLSGELFAHGADVVLGFVPSDPGSLFSSLTTGTPSSMYEAGFRVERRA